MFIFFFFSSRRRHTRFDCDWSSDVCSSDLLDPAEVERRVAQFRGVGPVWVTRAATFAEKAELFPGAVFVVGRSEERRVGKECRSRWWQYHLKKKIVMIIRCDKYHRAVMSST